MSRNVGVGIPKYWQLRDDHPFFNAAVHHDAAYDAADLFLAYEDLGYGQIKAEALEGDDPIYYRNLRSVRFASLRWLWDMAHKPASKKQIVAGFIKKADLLFLEMCTDSAKGYYDSNIGEIRQRPLLARLRLQAQAFMFYKIVRLYAINKYS